MCHITNRACRGEGKVAMAGRSKQEFSVVYGDLPYELDQRMSASRCSRTESWSWGSRHPRPISSAVDSIFTMQKLWWVINCKLQCHYCQLTEQVQTVIKQCSGWKGQGVKCQLIFVDQQFKIMNSVASLTAFWLQWLQNSRLVMHDCDTTSSSKWPQFLVRTWH